MTNHPKLSLKYETLTLRNLPKEATFALTQKIVVMFDSSLKSRHHSFTIERIEQYIHAVV